MAEFAEFLVGIGAVSLAIIMIYACLTIHR